MYPVGLMLDCRDLSFSFIYLTKILNIPMNFKKYIWKCRLLVLNTPNYTNQDYKNSKRYLSKTH